MNNKINLKKNIISPIDHGTTYKNSLLTIFINN